MVVDEFKHIIFCITSPVLHSVVQVFLALTNILISSEHWTSLVAEARPDLIAEPPDLIAEPRRNLFAEARPNAAEATMAARTKVFILLGAVREEGSL